MDQPRYATQEGISMHEGLIEDETSLERAVQMFDRFNGAAEGRVEVWFGARTPGGVTEDLYRRMVKASNERCIGITMHCAEIEADRVFLPPRTTLP